MDPAKVLFNTMIIPAAIRGNAQTFSIAFELNLTHEVFADTPADPAVWKKDIKNFPDFVRFALRNNAFKLNCGDPQKPLNITCTDPQQDNHASQLWAGMLGYAFTPEGASDIRQKNWKPGGSPMLLGSHKRVKNHITVFKGIPSLAQTGVAIQQVPGPITSTKDIFNQINSNVVLTGLKKTEMPDTVKNGIAFAHQAAVKAEQNRNQAIAALTSSLITNEHPALLSLSSRPEVMNIDPVEKKRRDDELKDLLNFYRAAQVVINERDFIQEAIEKLNSAVSARRFLGTIIDFQVVIPTGSAISELSLFFDDVAFANALKAQPQKWTLSYTPFSGNYVTSVISGAQGLLPKPVSAKYAGYYPNGIASLPGKSMVISWETESVRHNLKQASRSLNENSKLSGITVNHGQLNQWKATTPTDPALLVTYQIKNKQQNLLLKAAIKLNNHANNIHTKGHQLYITDGDWLTYNPGNDRQAGDSKLYEHDLTSGWLVYVRIKGHIYCLNEVSEYFGPYTDDPDLQRTRLPIGTDAMVHTLLPPPDSTPATGPAINLNGINNGFQFLWDGTTVSSKNPLRHQDQNYRNEKDRTAALIEEFTSSKDKLAIESLVLHLYSRRWLEVQSFPFPQKNKANAKFLLGRSFVFKNKEIPKPWLKFTTSLDYEYALVHQFHNGYSPITEKQLQAANIFSEAFPFLRDDHIKPLIVSLPENIYIDDEHKVNKKHTLGESNIDLVIRKGSIQHNTECVRYILPPQIPNFQTYLWYDFSKDDEFSKSRKLNEGELLHWYKRSQREPEEAPDKSNAVYTGGYNYLPDPVVTGFVIKFYYDRERTLEMDGIYQEKFCSYKGDNYPDLSVWKIILKDIAVQTDVQVDHFTKTLHVPIAPGRQIFAEIFPAFENDFACLADPLLAGTGLKNRSADGAYYYDLLKCGINHLSFTYALQRPLFEPKIEAISLNRFKSGTLNKQASTINLTLHVNYEHLNLWKGITIDDEQPTGEIDVFMLWDDYSLSHQGVQKSIKEKADERAEDKGYILIGKINFGATENKDQKYLQSIKRRSGNGPNSEDSSVFSADLSFELDHTFDLTYFTDAVLRIRNVSKYSRYFEDVPLSQLSESNKDDFSLWSEPFSAADPVKNYTAINYNPATSEMATAAYLFNNQKPGTLNIYKIVPLIVKDDFDSGKINYYQRIRFYFDQVALTGKDNRVGIIVSERKSVYQNFLASSISKAGLDIITDDLAHPLDLVNDQLTSANFNLDESLLEQDYLKQFKPQYDAAPASPLPEPIGLVSYVLNYDESQKLWYIDIEMKLRTKDGQELHNPFVQLFLTSYQPFSANYIFPDGSSKDTAGGYALDYRVSPPIKAEYFSIFPSRTFENPLILFRRHPKSWCSLTGSVASLFRRTSKDTLNTDFIIGVQRKGINGIWTNCELLAMNTQIVIDGQSSAVQTISGPRQYMLLLQSYQSVLKGGKSFGIEFKIRFHKQPFQSYRIVIYEADCFNELTPENLRDILNRTDSSGQPQHLFPTMIDGVYLRNTYTFNE